MKNYLTFEKFLTEAECDTILNNCKNSVTLSEAKIGNQKVNINKRKSSIGFIDEISEIDERLVDILKKHIQIKGHEFDSLGSYQFTEYKEGDFYDWHTDSAPDNDIYSTRFCSIVIQLNDEYSDGDLEIKNENEEDVKLTKGKGNLFLFYSNIEHRVTPVTNGVRYSLVNWVSLTPKKEFKKTII